MYINKFDIYINGNFLVSGYLYYEFRWILYNKNQQENGSLTVEYQEKYLQVL